MTAAALLPDEVGHRWGVWSIWMSVIGVLIPIVGPLIAAVLAAVGTRDAQRAGAELAGSVRAAWVLSAVSLLAGFVVVYLLIG
jgi:MFS family permease